MTSNFDLACGSETIRNVKEAKFCSDILDQCERTDYEGIFEQIFSIPLLLIEILKYLERPDLLNTSLVSKRWNFFSREVLRENKRCTAIFKPQNSCRSLKRLNSLLLNSEAVPFCGLSIYESCGQIHDCTRQSDMSELYNNIITKIDIKYLALDFDHDLECISLKCIREIITKKGFLLDGLSLKTIPSWNPVHRDIDHSFFKYIGLDLPGQWMPNLRYLEFPFRLHVDFVQTNFIKSLVEAAPKLQEIRGSVNQECLEFILPLKLANAVKDFNLRPTINTLQNCLAFSLENVKLNKLRFTTAPMLDRQVVFSRWSKSDQNDVARIIVQLLESAKESLTKIALDHFDLILITTVWNIPTLRKVVHLSMRYSYTVDIMDGSSTLGKLDWAKQFPNLKEVSLTNHPFLHAGRDFYLHNASWENNSHYVCESVTSFHLTKSEFFGVPARIQLFQKIFPNVKEFYSKDVRQAVSILEELWTAWSDLETIHMWVEFDRGSVMTTPSCKNCDSVILGCGEPEAAYLLKNVEELKSLEIVPTKPNIFNLQKLKKLMIHLFHWDSSCATNRPTLSDKVFLTRLVGHCAFSRLPGLSVEIHRHLCKTSDSCYLALNHLKPFVKFVEFDKSQCLDYELF